MFVELVQQIIGEHLLLFEEQSYHGLVANVYHQTVGLNFSGDLVFEVDDWGKVVHGRVVRSFFCEVVGSQHKSMQSLLHISKGILRVDSTEVGLLNSLLKVWHFILILLLDFAGILRKLKETKAFHGTILPLCLIASHKI